MPACRLDRRELASVRHQAAHRLEHHEEHVTFVRRRGIHVTEDFGPYILGISREKANPRSYKDQLIPQRGDGVDGFEVLLTREGNLGHGAFEHGLFAADWGDFAEANLPDRGLEAFPIECADGHLAMEYTVMVYDLAADHEGSQEVTAIVVTGLKGVVRVHRHVDLDLGRVPVDIAHEVGANLEGLQKQVVRHRNVKPPCVTSNTESCCRMQHLQSVRGVADAVHFIFQVAQNGHVISFTISPCTPTLRWSLRSICIKEQAEFNPPTSVTEPRLSNNNIIAQYMPFSQIFLESPKAVFI